MKSIFKWIIALVIFGVIFTIMISKEFDFEKLLKWEIITVVIVSVIVWLYFIWRRNMHLKDTMVCIQFLDD